VTTPSWERFATWREPLVIAIASRIYAIGALLVATSLNIPRLEGPPLASPFLIWDGEWYLRIARDGYHAAALSTPFGIGYHDFAFFPVWPAVLRIASLNGALPLEVVAPVTANLLFVLAAIPIFRLLGQLGGSTAARFGLLLFAFSPAAYIYSLAYSEPVFLLITGVFFLTRLPVGAGLLGALGQLTRLSGAAIAAASIPDLLDSATRRRGIFAIGGVILAFAAWWMAIALLTGDPFGYLLGSPSWYLAQNPTPNPAGIAGILADPTGLGVLSAILVALLVAGTLKIVRRGDPRLVVFSASCVASAFLVTPDTMPRLVAVAFPAFGGLALLLPSNRTRWLLVITFAGFEAVLGALAAARFLVP